MSNTNDLYYIKQDVTQHEYEMHKYIYNLKLSGVYAPKIVSYNKKTKEMIIMKIGNMNISDWYGDSCKKISNELFDKIRQIIKTLYDNNIIYPDITGYNFIEYDDKLWIIDFEHSYFKINKRTQFVDKFINGLNRWNPEFT